MNIIRAKIAIWLITNIVARISAKGVISFAYEIVNANEIKIRSKSD